MNDVHTQVIRRQDNSTLLCLGRTSQPPPPHPLFLSCGLWQCVCVCVWPCSHPVAMCVCVWPWMVLLLWLQLTPGKSCSGGTPSIGSVLGSSHGHTHTHTHTHTHSLTHLMKKESGLVASRRCRKQINSALPHRPCSRRAPFPPRE